MNTRLYKTIIFAAMALFILLPAIALAQDAESGSGIAARFLGGGLNIVGAVLSPLGYAVMKLTSYITMLGGMALNAAVYFTITQMAANLNNPSFTAVDEAWKVIRDLANMGFIFVLLWASLKLIVGNDEGKTQRLIVNMIIAAILINFSLFFTKIVIDVANLLALTFYSALAPIPDGSDFTTSGISNSIMDALKITTLFKSDSLLLSSNLFVVTVLSSIVLLITAFMFFAVTIMLVIRYVVLIFVLILSPIAFVSKVLPGLDDIAKQWKDTLIGQAFFAPIFFLLLWISIKVGRNVSDVVFKDASGFGNAFSSAQGVSTLINFAVIITFLIISLVTAKKYADMAPSAVGKATKWAMGAAGGMSFGVAGRLGRNTIGMTGSMMADSEALKKAEEKGGMKGAMARLGLAAGRKAAKSSFDVRSTGGYENLTDATGVSFGKGIGKGGFEQKVKDIAKEQKEQAEALKPSDLVVHKAEQELDQTKKADEGLLQKERVDERERRQNAWDDTIRRKGDAVARGASAEELQAIDKEISEAEKSFRATDDIFKYKQSKIDSAQARVDELKGKSEDEDRKRRIREIRIRDRVGEKEAKRRLADEENLRFQRVEELKRSGMGDKEAKEKAKAEGVGWAPEEIKSAGNKRQETFAARLENPNLKDFSWVKGSALDKVIFTSKGYREGAMKIRKAIKDKKPADKLAEELTKAKESGADEGGSSAPGTGPTGGTSGGTGGPTPPPASPGPSTTP